MMHFEFIDTPPIWLPTSGTSHRYTWTASDAATLTDDGGGLISQWAVEYGTARNMAATTTQRPTLGGTPPSLDFDGTANRLRHASGRMFTTPGGFDFTIGIRANMDALGASNEHLVSDWGSNWGWSIYITTAGAIGFTWRGGSSLHQIRESNTGVIVAGTWHSIIVTRDRSTALASGVRIYVDGTEVTYAVSTDGGTLQNADGQSTFGARGNGTSNFFDGKMQKVSVFEAIQSSGNLASLNTYLSTADY